MTMTISAKKANGTFSYEVHNCGQLIEAGDKYPTRALAEISARVCYNELHRAGFVWSKPFCQNDYMTEAEILRAMGF